jgi:prophage tail gpP-like protein
MSETVTVVGSRKPMTVKVNGRTLLEYTEAECGRDLADIAGSFRVSYFPRAALSGFGSATPVSQAGVAEAMRITEHDPVEVLIHGQTVMKGWVDDIQLRIDGDGFQAAISGRDVTGDLVDAHANPTGPGEYRQITLMNLVQTLCSPFSLAVSADIDVGAPFTLVALETAETAMAAIERHSRQRGILVTSDGIGGVVLTQSGQTRAPDSLRLPGNVHAMEGRISSRGRFSDVWVKGAFRNLQRPAQAPLSVGSAPLDAPLGASGAGPTPADQEAAATLRYGHAIDPVVRRYRPRVWLAATQSGGSAATQAAGNPVDPNGATTQVAAGAYRAGTRTPRRKAMTPRTDASPWTLQDQAEWRMRSTRAQASMRVYSVKGLKTPRGLWLPNQLVLVQDQYAGIDCDMLIGAVTWVDGQDGYRTRISVVDPDSYDLTGDEDTRHNGLRRTKRARAFDGSATTRAGA